MWELLGKTHFLSARTAESAGLEEADGGQLCCLVGKVCLRVKKTQEDKAVGRGWGGGKQIQMTLSIRLDPAVPEASMDFSVTEASMDFSVTYSLSSLNQLEMGFYILKKKRILAITFLF